MEEDKITYARQFLLDLLEKRRLRSWCQESGALHISMFKIARGFMNPTYAVMCHLLPYIPPAHWVYFTDEEIPYEVRTLPEWRPEAISAFVRCHKRDWKEIGQRYGISESLANNIFVSHRARPTVSLIRNARKDVNPEDFFTEGDLADDGLFYPERGDIVTVQGRTVLVISTERRNDVFFDIVICFYLLDFYHNFFCQSQNLKKILRNLDYPSCFPQHEFLRPVDEGQFFQRIALNL